MGTKLRWIKLNPIDDRGKRSTGRYFLCILAREAWVIDEVKKIKGSVRKVFSSKMEKRVFADSGVGRTVPSRKYKKSKELKLSLRKI